MNKTFSAQERPLDLLPRDTLLSTYIHPFPTSLQRLHPKLHIRTIHIREIIPPQQDRTQRHTIDILPSTHLHRSLQDATGPHEPQHAAAGLHEPTGYELVCFARVPGLDYGLPLLGCDLQLPETAVYH